MISRRCSKKLRCSQGGSFDHVDFISSSIKVAQQLSVPGKGRGVVAAEAIAPGTLIMASKVLAIVSSAETLGRVAVSVDPYSWSVAVGTGSQLLTLIVHKLSAHPELDVELYSLSGGPEFESSPLTPEQCRHIALPRIRAISSANRFGIMTIADSPLLKSLKSHEFSSESNHRDTAGNGSGLWIRPSFFNHSLHLMLLGLMLGIFSSFARIELSLQELS